MKERKAVRAALTLEVAGGCHEVVRADQVQCESIISQTTAAADAMNPHEHRKRLVS